MGKALEECPIQELLPTAVAAPWWTWISWQAVVTLLPPQPCTTCTLCKCTNRISTAAPSPTTNRSSRVQATNRTRAPTKCKACNTTPRTRKGKTSYRSQKETTSVSTSNNSSSRQTSTQTLSTNSSQWTTPACPSLQMPCCSRTPTGMTITRRIITAWVEVALALPVGPPGSTHAVVIIARGRRTITRLEARSSWELLPVRILWRMSTSPIALICPCWGRLSRICQM